MEALTYWAERLEPVIRDESHDEVIIVFCNRTGIEGDAVYSGTSAVIGIHQGEVKVYGLLGRGVKDLLIVDTDDPPFANLTMRKKKTYLNPTKYDSKPSRQTDDGACGTLLLTPLPMDPHDRTPTKCLVQDPISPPGPTSCAREHSLTPPRSSTLQTTAAEGSVISTPTTPGPTPMSARPPELNVPRPRSRAVRDRLDGLGSQSDEVVNDTRGLDESAAIEGNDSQDNNLFRYKSSPPSSSSTLPGPVPTRPLPEPRLKSGRIRGLKQQEDQDEEPTSSDKTTHTTPARPSSPKSRNASRLGRHTERWCDTDVEQSDLEFHQASQHRAQSAVPPGRNYVDKSTHKRPRSPKLRSTSLSGRYPGLDDELLERALDFYLRSIPLGLRDEMIASGAHMSPSDGPIGDQDQVRESARSLSHRQHSNSRPFRLDSPGTKPTKSNAPDTEDHNSMIWKEISKVVGEHMRRAESREAPRGRRRSRSVSSTEARRGSCATSPSPSRTRSRDGRMGSRRGSSRQESGNESVASRTTPPSTARREVAPIRSVRDPSLGPPLDPDDEIIAEIIFHRPSRATCDSESKPAEASGARPQVTGSTVSPRTTELSQDSALGQSMVELCVPAEGDSEKTPTINKQTAAKQGLGLLALHTTTEDLGDLRAPNLSTASLHTLSSYEASPVTPPPRELDPRTPKPMFLGMDCVSAIDPVPEHLLAVRAEPLDTALDERIMARIERSRSALS